MEPRKEPTTPPSHSNLHHSRLSQLRATVQGAYRMSRTWHCPAFVYRPLHVIPPYTCTMDEDLARALCDADGYARVDAAEEEPHE